LVFAKDTELFVANSDGSNAHKIYTSSGPVFAARFSPDGQRIRFTVSDTEHNATSLWEVGRDGANAHAMLAGWPFESTACCGSWTANGKYYIFQAGQTISSTNLVVTSLWALPEAQLEMNPAPVQITAGPMSFGNAFMAPDNTKIWAIGVQPTVEVVKYEAKKKRFVPLIAGLSATDVDFSNDGKWIAYVSIPEGTLWRARADGSERLRLTSDSERAALPHWSPDGRQIAYASTKNGSWKLSLVSANGGDAHEMLPESGSQIDANWSPDGERLMFGEYNRDQSGLKIRILNFKTRKITTIPGSNGLFSPRWSPDGQYIAALSPNGTDLMLFDFKTQKWIPWLKEPAGSFSYPAWSADSQYLYFDDLVTGAEAIRRVKVGGNDAELVFELGNLERYPGALGPWAGRAADGSWMFVRDRSTQEVYQLSLELP
jgi:Tol biopolymer transport system component